jgi:hypothetical protein
MRFNSRFFVVSKAMSLCWLLAHSILAVLVSVGYAMFFVLSTLFSGNDGAWDTFAALGTYPAIVLGFWPISFSAYVRRHFQVSGMLSMAAIVTLLYTMLYRNLT